MHVIPDILFRAPLPIVIIAILTVKTIQVYFNLLSLICLHISVYNSIDFCSIFSNLPCSLAHFSIFYCCNCLSVNFQAFVNRNEKLSVKQNRTAWNKHHSGVQQRDACTLRTHDHEPACFRAVDDSAATVGTVVAHHTIIPRTVSGYRANAFAQFWKQGVEMYRRGVKLIDFGCFNLFVFQLLSFKFILCNSLYMFNSVLIEVLGIGHSDAWVYYKYPRPGPASLHFIHSFVDRPIYAEIVRNKDTAPWIANCSH